MSAYEIGYTLGDDLAAALAALRERARAALERYVNARARSVAVRELERLSDETLAELGLRRGEIRERVRRQEMPWS